jgi:hypothetical protein
VPTYRSLLTGKVTAADANRALTDLRTIRTERITHARHTLAEALREAARHEDPRLSPEGLDERRRELAAAARKTAGEELAAIERDARAAQEAITDFAADQAAATGDSTTQLLEETRAARAWHRARTLLDSGRSVPSVVAGADVDTLRALRAELPTYLAAQTTPPTGIEASLAEDFDPAPVLRTIDRALSEKLPGDQGHALRYRLGMDEVTPALDILLTALRAEVNDAVRSDSHGLETAIAARMADSHARATLDAVGAE